MGMRQHEERNNRSPLCLSYSMNHFIIINLLFFSGDGGISGEALGGWGGSGRGRGASAGASMSRAYGQLWSRGSVWVIQLRCEYGTNAIGLATGYIDTNLQGKR